MFKKIILGLVGVMLVASVGYAAPLTDFSQGKVAVDILSRPSLDLSFPEYANRICDGQMATGKAGNMDYGLTVGLGNQWALQYRNHNADSKDYNYHDYYYNSEEAIELKAHEFNVVYKLDENLAAFVGATSTKSNFSRKEWWNGGVARVSDEYVEQKTNGKNIKGAHIGLIGTVPLSEKASAYSVLSVGNKLDSFEVGLAYEVGKNTEFNMFYTDRKYKKLKINDEEYYDYRQQSDDYELDYKAKGIGWGLTFKF